nr:MAG TPA: hypothetical protein [Caudoviricetes sp.]
MNLLESKFDKVEDRAGCACQNGVLQLAHFVVVQQIADALRGDLHVGVIVGHGVVVAPRSDEGQPVDQLLAGHEPQHINEVVLGHFRRDNPFHEGCSLKMTSAPEACVKISQDPEHQKIVIVFCHGKLLTSWLKPCTLQDKALDILDTKKEKCSEPHPGSRDASRNGNRLEERRFSCILQAYPGKYRRYIQVCRS